MVRIGQEFEIDKITVTIKEVIPYFQPTGKRMLLVGYTIQDGKFVSTIAHFFMGAKADARKPIEDAVKFYTDNMAIIKGVPRQA